MKQQLLTPELKEKVEAKMRECFAIAEKHYGIKFEFPEIRYNIKNWTGGLAYRDLNLVRYNLILLVENEDKYVSSTVPHETAHMIVNRLFRDGIFKLADGKKRLMPHGKEWKEVMQLLGVPANVTHTYNVASIERSSRSRKRRKDKVQGILQQFHELQEDQRQKFINALLPYFEQTITQQG